MAYRVSNWNSLYENNRTRELKRLEWVPVPNRMDGEGYCELVHHPNGAAHLGAWIAILEIASRRHPRGTIPQEGAVALGRISHLPAELFEEVLPRLLKIGWIEYIDEAEKTPENAREVLENLRSRTLPQEGAEIPRRAREEWNGIEGNRKEQNRTAGALALVPAEPRGNGAVEWWRLWSSIRGTNHQQQAMQAYLSVVTTELEASAMECTASYLQSLDSPNKGYNPENFLFEQAKDQFQARWPARPKPNGSSRSLADRTKDLIARRIANGERPI